MEASTPTPGPSPTQKSNKIVGLVLGAVLAVVALGLVVFFVTRESPEEKALQAVCKARADIQTRVDDLAATTLTNFTLDGFKANVEGIRNDVATIRTNEKELGVDRRADIKAANQQFTTSLTTTLKSLGTSLSIDNAKEKLTQSGQELVSAYKQTLQPIDCTGVDISD